MANFINKAVLGATLAATALTAAAPADAQRYRRYNRGGGDVATGAIIGGLVGLGIGAAIASNNNNRRFYDRRFDRRFNRRFDPRFNGGFDPRFNGGFDPRFGGGAFYGQPQGFYGNPYGGGYGYAPRCYVVRQFDPYLGRRIRTRVCN